MKNKEVNFVLPWPPSVNQLWTTTRRGNWYTTKVAKDFKETVYYYVFSKKAKHFFETDDRLEMQLSAYPPDNRRRDLDNLMKVVCDALQGAEVFPDDSQIKRIRLEMLEKDEQGGRVIVSMKKID